MSRKEDFLRYISEVADKLRESKGPALIVSHYDADGISAASIVCKLLSELGIFYQLKIVEQLTPKMFSSITSSSYNPVFILDMGSGLKRPQIKDKEMFILDHHLPSREDRTDDDVYELNPNLYGIDGSTDISSSGIAYLLARELMDEYVTLSPMALIGALGDRQDVGEKFSFKNINLFILNEAKKYNIVQVRIGLRLFGSLSRSLVKALAYTVDPYIPGISGNEAASLNFLTKIGIKVVKEGKPRTLKDLSEDEVRALATELIKYMINTGLPVSEAERIFGYNYYIRREQSPLADLREFSYVLNACGRMERHDLGIALCLHRSGEHVREALSLLKDYRRVISETLSFIRGNKDAIVRTYERVLHISLGDVINDKTAGAIASLITSSEANTSHKVICVSVNSKDNLVKLSLRKGKKVQKDIHIGEILSKLSEKYGIVGGGHENAGGALIRRDKLNEFLNDLDKMLKI